MAIDEEGMAEGLPDQGLAQGPQQPPPQPPQQAQKPGVGPGRHLLTGLVGVLLDGLQAGVQTPQSGQGFSQSAQRAAQLPQERQQKNIALQSQALQMKSQLAQSHVQDLQTKLLVSKLDEQAESGLTDAGWNFYQQALKNGTAKMVSGETDSPGTATAKQKELHDANPDSSINTFVGPGMKKGTWGVWEIFPKNTLQDDMSFTIPGSKAGGGQIEDENVKIPAGTDMGTTKTLVSQKFRDMAARLHDESTQKVQGMKGDTAETVQGMKNQAAAAKGAAKPASDKDTDQSYNTQIKRLDSTRKPIDDAAARLARLGSSLNLKTPQADAEIAPQLMVAMAGGAGSGVRITQAEIDRTEGGRSGWENMKARIQHWNSDPSQALSLTDTQRNQMRQMVKMVNDKVTSKQAILNSAEQGLTNAKNKSEHRQIMADLHKQLEAVDSGKFPDRATATAVRKATAQAKPSGGDSLGIR